MYKYNPSTISINGIDENLFLQYQIKYRESFESVLKQFFDFSRVDGELEKIQAPVLLDMDYIIL